MKILFSAHKVGSGGTRCFAGSLFKAIHQLAERASGKRPSPSIVSNFAADKNSVGDNLSMG
ncbi:MAG: hypothetical protein NTV93_15010 [Verrucomicrobia bacterium]|nr:hypothetical protein [Verrucomicrobiota bacterium]